MPKTKRNAANGPAEGFDQHVILYAKGWYKRSGNIKADLKALLMKYSGSGRGDIPDHDVMQMLVDAFVMYACDNTYNSSEAIMEMLGLKWSKAFARFNRTPEQVMIGSLSIIDGGFVDMGQKFDISFENESLTPA